MTVLLLLLALVAVVVGADLAVAGGQRIARALGMSELLAGLTVASIGTSLPELATTASAAWNSSGSAGVDAAGVGIGNLLGSNLFMLTFVLGLSGVLQPMVVKPASIRRDGVMLGVAMLAFLVVGWNLLIGRVEGFVLLLGFVAYLVFTVRQEQQGERALRAEAQASAEAAGEPPPVPGVIERTDFARVVGGLVLVLGGAELVVRQGVSLAADLGVPGTVVGIFVGIGTSLPEVVVSVRAALTGAADIGIGNIIGSGITNLLLCLGFAALVHPLPVPDLAMTFDWPFAAAITFVALALLFENRDLTRAEGSALLVLFALYLYLRTAVVGA